MSLVQRLIMSTIDIRENDITNNDEIEVTDGERDDHDGAKSDIIIVVRQKRRDIGKL